MINVKTVGLNEFLNVFNENKKYMLSQYSWKFLEEPYENYANSNLYVTDNNSTFAISKNGTILSFTYNIQDSSAKDVVNAAIRLGGDKIKVYESLKNIFQNFGFSDILKKIPWDENDIPKGWHPSFEKEDLYLLALPSREIEEREITDDFDSLDVRDKLKYLTKTDDAKSRKNNKDIDEDLIL